MVFIDVHAHVYGDAFTDKEDVIKRAKDAKVLKIINNATSFEEFETILDITKSDSIFASALGLYPDVINEKDDEYIQKSLDFITQHKNEICAIGEIGLDYKWTKNEELQYKQRKYFLTQIELAKKLDKPIIVHSRNAEKDVIDCISQTGYTKVILHCFCGKLSLAKEAVKKGYYFSFPPKIVTDKQFEQLCQIVPIHQILTETDSPYLHYIRGERNEPKNVPKSVEKIAEIKGLDVKEMEHNIYANFMRLFL
ncbi:MAG: TatD family hydrolase [Candidatus Woesearchaeota archaeon]